MRNAEETGKRQTSLGFFLEQFQRGIWENLRTFAFHNKTLFELMFIFIYALQQVWLLQATFTKSGDELRYAVALYVVLVLSTFALQKIVMESRIKVLEGELTNFGNLYLTTADQARFLDGQNKQLQTELSKAYHVKNNRNH
jgi:hypothetical protein